MHPAPRQQEGELVGKEHDEFESDAGRDGILSCVEDT